VKLELVDCQYNNGYFSNIIHHLQAILKISGSLTINCVVNIGDAVMGENSQFGV